MSDRQQDRVRRRIARTVPYIITFAVMLPGVYVIRRLGPYAHMDPGYAFTAVDVVVGFVAMVLFAKVAKWKQSRGAEE